jgi:hypothetical protein
MAGLAGQKVRVSETKYASYSAGYWLRAKTVSTVNSVTVFAGQRLRASQG